MDTGELISLYRKEAGLTIDELAAKSGVPKGTLNKIIGGVTKAPTLDNMKAIAKALGKRLADFDDDSPKAKITPLYSSEAMSVARDYDSLDNWGRRAVRELVDTEKARCEDETRFLVEADAAGEDKVINLFDEGSAAGLALGETGQGCQPYTLKPEDPRGAAFAIRVDGDSMEPDFPNGSIAFVNHDEMRDGDIGVFCVDGATVIKQWHYDKFMGITYLFSLNRKRQDADLVFTPGSGRSLVWQGRVITKKHYPLPGAPW